jgi:hypothetical protein
MCSEPESLLHIKGQTSLIRIPEKVDEGLRTLEQAMESSSDLVVDEASKNEVHFGLHFL